MGKGETMEKKAIFLGVTKLHSNKKNQDYRKVDFYVPPYKSVEGYDRGGVVSTFTALDSTLGTGIKVGSIVVPQYDYDACAQRAELVGITVIQDTPYTAADFE